jgi:small conductance mechanosensitive channel
MIDIQPIINIAVEKIFSYAPKFFLALLTLLIGLRMTSLAVSLAEKGMQKRKLEASLQSFLGSLIGIVLKILLFISVASMLGVQTTSFVAVLGAAGLAVGLALQGSLSNFAGGVLILFFKHLKVGDYVTASGFTGRVTRIEILYTIILTDDAKTVIIPNALLSNAPITLHKEKKQ